MMRLANKIALVTGAGSGIGRGIACRFAAEGVSLTLSDIAEAGLQETAALIEEAGGRVTDFDGGERYWERGNVIAGPPGVVDDLLALASPILGEDRI